MLVEAEVRRVLQAAIAGLGSQKAFAARHGFSRAYVNDVLHERRAITDRLCAAIGVKRFVTYTTEDTKREPAK